MSERGRAEPPGHLARHDAPVAVQQEPVQKRGQRNETRRSRGARATATSPPRANAVWRISPRARTPRHIEPVEYRDKNMRIVGLVALAIIATTGHAQRGRGGALPRSNDGPYGALSYRFIGPPGNRTISVAGIPGNSATYYVGAASGGIWKTTDAGTTWRPIFDKHPVSSIGALAIAPSDSNLIWAGTGETFIRSHISLGWGIFKSTDAGATWTKMGLENTGRIGRIVIHPTNPEHRPRRRVRPRVRAAGGSGHLSHHGRRSHVEQGSLRQRQHGRDRRRHAPDRSEHPLRGYLADRGEDLGPDERWRRERNLEKYRRRRDVGSPYRQRIADSTFRQGWPGYFARQSATHLRAHRNRKGRAVERRTDRHR